MRGFAGLLPAGCNANHCAGRFQADAKTGTLTFAPGGTMKTITIEVEPDRRSPRAAGIFLIVETKLVLHYDPAMYLRILALLCLALLIPFSRAGAQPPKDIDLALYIELADFVVPKVAKKRDPKSGFFVGGQNDTALIRKLTEINGRTIAELEEDMRPGAKSDVGSRSGFLGPDEKLLEVLAMDNKTVVEEWGLTHQALARHLHAMGSIGYWQLKHKKDEREFLYQGRRFKVKLNIALGTQLSPFRDGTKSNANATVSNLDNGNKLTYGLLVPYMIERYGFYEGKGTPYKLEPAKALEVFDFLRPKTK